VNRNSLASVSRCHRRGSAPVPASGGGSNVPHMNRAVKGHELGTASVSFHTPAPATRERSGCDLNILANCPRSKATSRRQLTVETTDTSRGRAAHRMATALLNRKAVGNLRLIGVNRKTDRRERMKKLVMRFTRDEIGQDLVEYALLLGVITVLCVVAIQTIGTQVAQIYNAVVAIVTPIA
jgi:Flp pilus assembly pilin Flp